LIMSAAPTNTPILVKFGLVGNSQEIGVMCLFVVSFFRGLT